MQTKEFSQALISALAAIFVMIFLTSFGMANADTFSFSPMMPSPIQSQLTLHQQDLNGLRITTISDGLQLTNHPFALSSLIPTLKQPSEQQQQQQQNQTTQQQQPLTASELNNNSNKLDNHSPSVISELPF
jgi:hypothetical protein